MNKRIFSLTLAVAFLFISIVGRIGFVTMSNTYSVADTYNSYSLNIDKLIPTLYYSDGKKLTNNQPQLVAIIRPTEKCYGELSLLFDYDKRQELMKELSKGFPVVEKIDNYVSLDYIQIKEIKSTKNTCSQLVDKQSSGMLKYLPSQIGELKINYSVDALGRILNGDEGELINNNYNSKQGLKLTLDSKIQQITYEACKNMKMGCALVLDAKSGNILASVTKPDSSYINKTFQQYSVGSVFKVVVASCAIENNINTIYECKGTIVVGDTTFSCQNKNAHHNQNLKQALANSCNCYFVNLALQLGSDKIINIADAFGFNESTNIYSDWNIKNAYMPTKSDLQFKGQLALLGFGQGKLTSTPLQIARSLCAIANNGQLPDVKLVTSQIDDDGKPIELYKNTSKQAISTSTADTMLKYLSFVVSDGTGSNAQSYNKKSAGKTATAQTGQYVNGEELLNTWFAGIYPNDDPKYVIVVMTEKGSSGSADCCPIFRTIVENLSD